MLYELRTYHMVPGKLQAIHDRFSQHTLRLFASHGMKVVDFWEDADPESNRIYYLLEFADRETRDRSWDQFRADPEWVKVKTESEAAGPIVENAVSTFMQRVSYWGR